MSDPSDRKEHIRRALLALGWPDGGFIVDDDGSPLGSWQPYSAFTTNPSGTLVEVWAGPNAGTDPAHVVIAGQPLSKAQLRALVTDIPKPRDVATIATKTAGAGREIGSPETGSSKGLPVHLEGKVHGPRVDASDAGRELVFYARTFGGAYVRIHAAMDGAGPVELFIEPPGPSTGQDGPTAPASTGPGLPPRGPDLPTPEQ